ncbi:MAG: O-antigen ligase family protein [Betaproteobacteria bacterium]|nr:O-antigen ligase family protein [Betaproteobacteria bacterium]
MEPAGSMFFFSFAALLVLAPLYKAGNRPLPLLLLELGAVGLLFVIAGVHRAPLALPRTVWTAIGILLVYPLIQLIPLPQALWVALPGHAEYAVVFERFAAKDVSAIWRAISVIPSATEYGWLALLPALACLLAAMRLSPAHVARLLLIMAVFAGLEGLLGLLQVGSGGESIFYLRNDQAFGTATGTFVNRNHLAAMLAMTLPVMVGLLVFSMRPGRRHRGRRRTSHLVSEAFAQRGLLFASAVMVLICLFFTRSRAGIGSALVALACSAILLVRARAASEGTTKTRLATFLVMALVGAAIALSIVIGVAPILERLEPNELRLSTEGRMAMYAATFRAAMEFLPFGSGLSTFADVFPRFQPGGGFVDHAHNDYLQAFMELGLAAPIAIALLLAAYVMRMTELLWREGGRSFTLLQLGAGVGLLPLILHSLFDFALHMPANAMWFATLAGVMFHKGVSAREQAEEESKRRRPVPMPMSAPATEIPTPT